MNVWMPEDNVFVTNLIALIEIAKESIRLFEIDKERTLIKIHSIDSRIKTIEENLEILKTIALIVSIVEYQQLIFKKASLIEEGMYLQDKITFLERNIRNKKDAIMKYEREIKEVSFKVLEFKKRE